MAPQSDPGDAKRAARGLGLERAHALSLLLPAALLLWPGPGAPLGGDPAPALSGAGWVALASLPAGLLLLLRGAYRRAPAALGYVGFLAVGALWNALRPPTDTLEATRALLLGFATLLALLGGASLDAPGRRWLATGLVGLSALALAPATFASGTGLAGALGNTAATSEVAMAGACVGALWCAHSRKALRGIGAIVVALFVVHAARAPVLASLVVLIAVLVAALAASPERARRLALLALAIGVIAIAGSVRLARGTAAVPSVDAQGAELPAPSDVGGVGVRALVARSSLALWASTPWLGVGRGQFAAAFPPFRDQAEIALSSLDHRLPGQTTEVEHPHNDWLAGLVETGVIGGILWIGFLIVVAGRAVRLLRSRDTTDAALGAAALALLAEAVLRGPLLHEPAAAVAAFAAFGALPSGSHAPTRSVLARLCVYGALLGTLVLAPRALDLVAHGRALAAVAAGEGDPAPQVRRALEACPDSVTARSLQARLATLEAAARGAHAAPDVVPLWNAVLELRPHRFEAWMELGNAWARAQQLDEARDAYERALELDDADPGLLRNLARLEIAAGRPDAALAYIDRLERAGRLPAGWLDEAALSALRALELETARALLARARPDWRDLSAQALWERAEQLPPADEELARALRGLAHLEWAREQIEAGTPDLAVRSYRQALRGLAWSPAPDTDSDVVPALRLEFAGALLRAGKADEAAAEAIRARSGPGESPPLPDWARDELMGAGLLGR